METENLYSGMLEQLGAINGPIRDSVEHLNETLSCITTTINDLKERVRRHPFEDDYDEIVFFKYTKPRFCSWNIYVVELHHILLATPIGTDQMRRDYYMNEMEVFHRFFRQHAFHYQYYLKDEKAKDGDFFLRRNKSLFPPGRELIPDDPDFSTDLDHLFAVFRAYEMLRDFMVKRIRLLYQEPNNILLQEILKTRKRWWSGSKMDLVEFAYGIYFTQRVTGGNADISDIIGWLEESFNEDLSQAYRMFIDITRRKNISLTKCLDEMREAIHNHVEESLRYKSKKPRPKT